MQKKSVFLVVCFLCLFFAAAGYGRPAGDDLDQGIKQYAAENYDEAIELLKKARAGQPQSSAAAYYLGMAYKQTTEYDKALPHLEDAMMLAPPVKDALSQYISVLYLLDRLDQAEQWIEKAEKENSDPANTAYWKGMVLIKKNRCADAIAPLEKARQLDPKLAQSADYAIGLCHYNQNELEKARERFKAAVVYDPASDLAANARRYQEAIDEGLFPTRPLRVTLGLYGGYDSNLILKPRNDTFAPGIGSPGSAFFKPSLRVEFAPRFEGPWLLSALYAFNAAYHSSFVHSEDAMSHTVAVLPGYNFGRFSVSLLAAYTSYLLRTDPDMFPDENANLKRYLEYVTTGAVFKLLATPNNILEVFLGYDKKEFYHQNLTVAAENRDAVGPRAYLSWTWFFLPRGFVSARYDYNEDRTDGVYWDNKLHRLSASVNIPVLPAAVAAKAGGLYVQAACGFSFANYTYERNFLNDDLVFTTEKRRDRLYDASVGLNWEIVKNLGLVLQYKFIRSDSNMPVFAYDDHIWTAGIEFKI